MKTEYRKWIGKKLQKLRSDKGVTQYEISFTINTKVPTYQAYEESRAVPPIPVLKKICAYYSMTIDEFLKDCPVFSSY